MEAKDFVDPVDVVAHLAPRQGDRVVDFGSGSGAYVYAAARAVGEEGRVYAVDVQKDLLVRIINEARRQGLENVDMLWTDLEIPGGTKFADNTIDLVLISNVLFQIPEKTLVLREAARIVKDTGRVALIDWTESFGGMGPHPDDVITQDMARVLIESSGLVCVQSFAPGSHHWGFVCRKQSSV